MNVMRSYELSNKEFESIRRMVYDYIGVNLTDAKRSLVISRLSKRLRELNMEGFGEYIEFLKRDPDELHILFNYITTNVTKFFREEHHFDYLKNVFLPEHVEKYKSGNKRIRLRVWSAGCSTGEEPYTIAMVLSEYFRNPQAYDIKIIASDINSETVEKAREGLYKYEEVQNIPRWMLKKYFKMGVGPNEGYFKVKDSLKELIEFKLINLTSSQKYAIDSSLDLIFCRNVFIYFDRDTQRRILERFYQHVMPDGLLFLGHSESINNSNSDPKRWRLVKHTIYKKLG